MTLEQIAEWRSRQNPLEKVLGKNSICPAITTRVAESIGGGYKCLNHTDMRRIRRYGGFKRFI